MPSNKTLFMDGPIADKKNEGVNERGMPIQDLDCGVFSHNIH